MNQSMGLDIVSEAFEKVAKQKSKYKPITVEKVVDLEYDLGTLLALDTNDINIKKLRSTQKEEYLLNLARDNTQLLLNKLWQLPCEKVEEAIVVKLPNPTFLLPREKPVPKPRPLTKWQQFAKDKGLQKRKKDKVTWDDMLKKWVPTHGYRRAAAEKDRDWVLEVPGNADPYQDQFEKKVVNRKEKVAKNEFQRLRNIASSHNIKVPHMGLPPSDNLSSTQLGTAEGLAKLSTASIGKFQPSLRNEKKNFKDKTLLGTKKRKLPPLRPADEKANNIDIMNSILNKKPKLDVSKAVNRQMFTEERTRSQEKMNSKGKGGKKSGKKRGGSGKHSSNSSSGGKKPPAGKGKRNPHTKTTGRKRR